MYHQQTSAVATYPVQGYGVAPGIAPGAAAYPAAYHAAAPIPGAYLAFPPASGTPAPETSTKPIQSIPPPPAEPAVTPKIAENAIRKLVTLELKQAGFERGEPTAVKRLEYEVQAFVQQLYQRAHEYANLANRAGAVAWDLAKACEEFDMPVSELHELSRKSKKRKRRLANVKPTTTLVPPRSRSPSPELLPSDDDDTPVVPATLRTLPSYLPPLPPKHTYMKTPASPPKKAALPSLEKKLKTASLVQKSLQNLLTATEDSTNNEDAELLGHIVNWETGLHPRKRWKVRK
ncbi:hypothetical protein CC2G_010797 [Coprinopsis cinerea AmutBmut pab1-1]|nr:hypothetical protein CC2G_010797 [Coprinopsis cinerea AmutBmut pab1-1]